MLFAVPPRVRPAPLRATPRRCPSCGPQCRALDVPLPQPQPVSDAALCKRPAGIDAQVFRQFHAEILSPRRPARAALAGPPRLRRRRLQAQPAAPAGRRRLRPARPARPLPAGSAQLPAAPASPELPVDFDLLPPPQRARRRTGPSQAGAAPDLVVYDRGYYRSNCSGPTGCADCRPSSASPVATAPPSMLHRRRRHRHARHHPARPRYPADPVPQVSRHALAAPPAAPRQVHARHDQVRAGHHLARLSPAATASPTCPTCTTARWAHSKRCTK